MRGKSGGEWGRRPLHEIGGPDPEALEAAERHASRLKIVRVQRSLRQHFSMPLMHSRKAVAQLDPSLG
jgi:hypothetical protein